MPEDHQSKILSLLNQFNNVMHQKQGQGGTVKLNRHVVGMYEWVMKDVAREVSGLKLPGSVQQCDTSKARPVGL